MRRVGSSLVVVVVLTVGLAGAATAVSPGPQQFPLVPAVQATVKDLCTGRNVAGFVALVSDSTGAQTAPSKTTSSGFVFTNLPPLADLVLQVSAPGYQPLGDPAAPSAGVPLPRAAGPTDRLNSKDAGPFQLPGGVRFFAGVRLAIGLMPDTPCSSPRPPHLVAVTGKVFDRATGAPVSGASVALIPRPGTGAMDPGPIAVTNGSFKVASLACGAYDVSVSAPNYVSLNPGTAIVDKRDGTPCAQPTGVDMEVVGITIQAFTDQFTELSSVQIDSVTLSSTYIFNLGESVHASVTAHDSDPIQNAGLTYKWSASGGNCTFSAQTSLATDITCNADGWAQIAFEVDAPDSTSATTYFTLAVGP